MPYSDKVLVVHDNWNDESRANPAMKWMEDYTRHYVDEREFDKGTASDQKNHTEDFSLQIPNGTIHKGRENAIKGLQAMYAPFAGQKHVPEFFACWETDYGYEMAGEANVYFKLHGLEEGEVKDPEGGKWHGYCPGGFRFEYVKEGSSFKLRKTIIFSDSSPALKLMLKHNQLNGDALAGMLSA